MVRNSKIIVAGGSGFIGRNLIIDLLKNGYEVISISKNSEKIKYKIKGVHYIFHDLSKPINIQKLKISKNIDSIINCSGYINHQNFLNGGQKVFNDHFKLITSLTKLAIDLKVESLVHIGSSDEYGNNRSPIKENVREDPISPYALGKLTSTHFLQQCFKQNILQPVILRPFLVFGENQKKDRFLPFLIHNCIEDNEFKVTKGEQIRDYLYIKDFNRAVINSINNKKAYGEVINIASGIPISIQEVIKQTVQIIGRGEPIFGGINYRIGESMELYANINKAKLILDWEPKYEFKDSLEKVINSYKEDD